MDFITLSITFLIVFFVFFAIRVSIKLLQRKGYLIFTKQEQANQLNSLKRINKFIAYFFAGVLVFMISVGLIMTLTQ